ncbi:MAG TPA: hypothetical protein DCM26_02305, partial [Desulfotomaculum sp.]|nr:hypothetical protein [Desulfotomaculum sp.]
MFDFFKFLKGLPADKQAQTLDVSPESPGVKEQSWRSQKLRTSLKENLTTLHFILADCYDVV